jgi:hypothetical protein
MSQAKASNTIDIVVTSYKRKFSQVLEENKNKKTVCLAQIIISGEDKSTRDNIDI